MTDTPDTRRAALEALAEWLRSYTDTLDDMAPSDTLRNNRLYGIAATLRALASRAEPPADVAALVEEARRLLRGWEYSEPDGTAEGELCAHIDRLAAALTAQAERIAELERTARFYAHGEEDERRRAEKAEALNKEAGEEFARQAKAWAACVSIYEGVDDDPDALEDRARALAAKLGEG